MEEDDASCCARRGELVTRRKMSVKGLEAPTTSTAGIYPPGGSLCNGTLLCSDFDYGDTLLLSCLGTVPVHVLPH
jgi:hypothetical protein